MSFKFKINWVLVNKLSLGPSPKIHEDINYLKGKGIKSVLSLCSTEESPYSSEFFKHFVHKRKILPDHKVNRSITKNDILTTLRMIDSFNNSFPIFIHCLAGIERSPLICMAWLIKNKNLNFQEALDYLIQVNPSTNPQPEDLITLREISF